MPEKTSRLNTIICLQFIAPKQQEQQDQQEVVIACTFGGGCFLKKLFSLGHIRPLASTCQMITLFTFGFQLTVEKSCKEHVLSRRYILGKHALCVCSPTHCSEEFKENFILLRAILEFKGTNNPALLYRCTGQYPNGYSREQINKISSYIDANHIYGYSESRCRKLRSMKDGKMKLDDDGMIPVCLSALQALHCSLATRSLSCIIAAVEPFRISR